VLVSEREREPWCGACAWHLELYEPERRRAELGWRWVDRATYRLAYRLTRSQFAALRGRLVERPGWSPARFTMLAAALAVLAAIAACLYFGVVLIAYHFPSPTIALGVVLLLFAALLWPRFGRPDRYAEPLTRDEAPTLFRLIDDVAQALGTPRPHVVTVDDSFNASAAAYGLRRRRVVCLGLPLLGVLSPQERVALVGHELGHFVNGDIRRGPLTGMPLRALAELVAVLDPGRRRSGGSFIAMLADLAMRPVLAVLRFLVWCGYVGLRWIGERDSQRAEYLADQLSARAAGTDAAVRLLDALVVDDLVLMLAAREARKRLGPADWRAAVEEMRAGLGTRLPGLRQLSVRDEASMFAGHPPSGLRAELVASLPYRPPAVTLTEADAQRMDDELKRQYARAGRTLAGG
jgi:Zn-dependent protease with chaperone function